VRSLALLGALLPTAALAAEGQSSISVTAGYAALVAEDGATPARQLDGNGGLGSVDYQRGFGDSWWLRVGLGGGAVSLGGEMSGVAVGTVGLTYAVDILRYVPYVGLGVGGVVVGGGAVRTHIDPVVDLAAGIEVQESPGFAWGIEARLSSFAAQTTLFTIGPRLVWKWGYF
jgi:hypothetical protein